MRSFIVSGIICLLFEGFTLGQNYVPFPTENARWYESIFDPRCMVSPSPCKYIESFIQGDTTINTKTYAKIYRYFVDREDDTKNFYYIGGIRSQEKRVYYLALNGLEYLLYDFDLAVDDIHISEFWHDTARVVSIDSVLTGDKYRRRYNLESIRVQEDYLYYPYSIIEGIGSTTGLLAGPNVYTGFEDSWRELKCFWQDGEILYHQGSGNCFEYTSTQNITTHEEISLFPNPASDYFSIDQPGYPITVQVISLAGEMVLTRQFAHHEKIRVPIGDLAPGTYLVRLITPDQVSVQKLSVVK